MVNKAARLDCRLPAITYKRKVISLAPRGRSVPVPGGLAVNSVLDWSHHEASILAKVKAKATLIAKLAYVGLGAEGADHASRCPSDSGIHGAHAPAFPTSCSRTATKQWPTAFVELTA